MPAQKKPADQLQRRNKPKTVDAQLIAMRRESEVPEAPKTLSQELKDEWDRSWRSALAIKAWNTQEHVTPLRRLFELRHLEEIMREEGSIDPFMEGSTGQRKLSPALEYAAKLRSEILQLEDRFGLNPIATMKLGIALGAAEESLGAMNTRIQQRLQGPADESDPRLAIHQSS